MSNNSLGFILICSALICCCPPASSAGQSAEDSPYKQISTRTYRLVTPPSTKKEEVDLMLEKVRSEIPRSEVVSKNENKVYYRLVVGCFNDIGSAKKLNAELSRKSIPSFITLSRKKYSVIASSHLSEQYALEEQKLLADKNVRSSIIKTTRSLPYWQIRSIDTYEIREAVYTASIMTMKDLITTVE